MRKLPEIETERLLKKYRIPSVRQALARSEDAAVREALTIGYPVALKVASPDIIHKTEAGGVLLNRADEQAVRHGFRTIMKTCRQKSPKARITGVLVSEMLPQGKREVIIGAKQDPHFGPVIMFGLGGIFVEVLRDVSFRVAPLERRDAHEMIREVRGFSILEGARGHGQVNLAALEETILRVSRMVWNNTGKGKHIQEVDINPLFIDEKSVTAVDARILV